MQKEKRKKQFLVRVTDASKCSPESRRSVEIAFESLVLAMILQEGKQPNKTASTMEARSNGR